MENPTKTEIIEIVMEDVENYMVLAEKDLRTGRSYFQWNFENEEREVEEKVCSGCEFLLDDDEDFVESEFYEDEYYHNTDECRNLYLKKKDLLVESRSGK